MLWKNSCIVATQMNLSCLQSVGWKDSLLRLNPYLLKRNHSGFILAHPHLNVINSFNKNKRKKNITRSDECVNIITASIWRQCKVWRVYTTVGHISNLLRQYHITPSCRVCTLLCTKGSYLQMCYRIICSYIAGHRLLFAAALLLQ